MKLIYRIARFLFVSLLLVLPVVAVMLYVLLSVPGIQRAIRDRAAGELTSLLGTPVEIGEVNIAPFNRVTVTDAVIMDDNGVEALRIGHLGAGLSLTELFLRGRIVVSYTELIDFHVNVYRDSIGSPLNVEPILARLRGKDDKKNSTFDLAVNTIVIRRGSMDYNVKSIPATDPDRFDANHVALRGFRADVTIPRLSSREITVEVKRLAVEERSGTALKNLRFNFTTDDKVSFLTDFRLDFGCSTLLFNEIEVAIPLLDMKGRSIADASVRANTLPGTVINPSDLAAFLPQLASVDSRLVLELEAAGTISDIELKRFTIDDNNGNLAVSLTGDISGLAGEKERKEIQLRRLRVFAMSETLCDILSGFVDLKPLLHAVIENAGEVEVTGSGSLGFSPFSSSYTGTVLTQAGAIDVDATFMKANGSGKPEIAGRIDFVNFTPDRLLESHAMKISRLSGSVTGKVALAGKLTNGHVEVDLDDIVINDKEVPGLLLTSSMSDGVVKADLATSGSAMGMRLSGSCNLADDLPVTKLVGQFDNIDPSLFSPSVPGSITSGGLTLFADLKGNNPDNLSGIIKISDLYLVDETRNRRLSVDHLSAGIKRDGEEYEITVDGDFIKADASGDLKFSGMVPAVKRMLAANFPALIKIPDSARGESEPAGGVAYNVIVRPDSALCRFFNFPVEIIDDVTVSGVIDNVAGRAEINLDAPYLWQKGKLIENTAFSASVDGTCRQTDVHASALLPSKYGPMTLSVNSQGSVDTIATALLWHIDAPSLFDGAIRVNTSLALDTVDNVAALRARFDVLESKIIFNDTVWKVSPSTVSLDPGRIAVDNFLIGRPGQQLDIDGVVSPDSTDVLTVGLTNIDLGYVFETLAINHVTFGGSATGQFYASRLFSDSRAMFTPRLDVKDFSYNGCVLGDARIASHWNNESQGIFLDVNIDGSDGKLTHALGEIRPLASELDLSFDADHLPVGFLAPFMDAFASDVSGYASGNARLYGTFHDINLAGRLLAEDFNMKVSFTNTDYTVARDSVIIVPGRIELNDIVLHDRYGNTALLSGELTHNCFHDASFRFDVTDAKDLLCYDIGENMTDYSWYGKVFGTGGVNIRGVPGMINIGVNLATAPGTSFTLKLDETEDATVYDFITFHDRDKARKDSIAALDPLPLMIKELRDRRVSEDESDPTEYVLDFNLDVTPAAHLTLLMDPKGGDKINSTGGGHIRMNYASTGDFRIFGTYTINRGSYNFTLQDIIIKDFQIVDGSYIKFNGNPDAAILDIKATYTVNANLTDLDESFSQDKELNRTNVPVSAVLLVTGDMRQPDIDFDLEFPTLTRDVDRKVRSIVSTREMMNRQIIYLLALNRFYTPEYMNATRGNELVSVASSTISSQLSSMLGQLSDKWSIAPNFRSDRGDFSDMEVDVALSSHLLNNRLLLNGNFGYRDKSLNNNSFIGDFDIRYLLNRSGSIQLKAYNRYNDQNYYLKSALTTQGIGVVFKRDFDNWKEFFSPIKYLFRRRPRKESVPEPDDQKAAPASTTTTEK